jgi:hypothetical protein
MPLRNSLKLLVLLVIPVLLSACPAGGRLGGGDEILDLSELLDGSYGVEYSGRIRVEDYGGAVSMTNTGGDLPPGLSMDEAGRVTGTPTYAGQFSFEVLASGMQGVADFTGDVDLSITADDVEDAFLGYAHDQLNNFDSVGGRMRDMWVRVGGTGLDQSTYTINPGIYVPGPNGVNNRGRADDVRIGDLSIDSLEWTLADWVPTNDPVLHEYEPDIFSQHVPEGDPPVIDTAAGTFTAGVDAGEQDIQIDHPDYGTVETRLMVTVPDWCPHGEHEGGWTEGICE